MRSEVIYGACGALFLISSAWAQDARYDSRSDRAVAGTPGAFRNLSPGEQWIARALAASEVRRDGRVPLSLNQIATLKELGMGFGQILRQMRADGDTNANNLGSVVSASRHDLNADRHDAMPRSDHDDVRMSNRDDGRDFDHDRPWRFDRDNDRRADRDLARHADRDDVRGVDHDGMRQGDRDSYRHADRDAPEMMECDGPILTMRAARDGSLLADRIRTPHRLVLAARRLQVAEVRAQLQTLPQHRRRPARSPA